MQATQVIAVAGSGFRLPFRGAIMAGVMTKEQSRREFLKRVGEGTAAGAGLKVLAQNPGAEPLKPAEIERLRRNLDPSQAPLEERLVGHLDGPTRIPEIFWTERA